MMWLSSCSPDSRKSIPGGRMPCTVLLLACSVLCIGTHARPLHASEALVANAIEEYTSAMEVKERNQRLAKFARAEQMFRQAADELAKSGQAASPELLVNLGNAALQAEHVGQAIVAFRQALEQDPGNVQAQQNLAYARRTLPDWVARSADTDLVETLFFWKRLYSERQVDVTAALLFLVGSGLLAIWIATGRTLWRNLAFAPAVVWLVLFGSSFLTPGQSAAEAVVISGGATLYSADSENSPPRMSDPLPDGAEVEILQSRDRWTEVRVTGRTGWLRASVLTAL